MNTLYMALKIVDIRHMGFVGSQISKVSSIKGFLFPTTTLFSHAWTGSYDGTALAILLVKNNGTSMWIL